MENKNIDPKEAYKEYNEKYDKKLMIEHDYDGIKELDNPPPPWLMWLFYITVIWAVWYLAWFHWFDVGRSQEADYLHEMEVAAEKYKDAGLDSESISILTSDEDLANGSEIYKKSCVACHSIDGTGGIGSNFTDDDWLYGNDVKEVFNTIKNGTDKGMTSFKSIGDDDILKVTSYILTEFKK